MLDYFVTALSVAFSVVLNILGLGFSNQCITSSEWERIRLGKKENVWKVNGENKALGGGAVGEFTHGKGSRIWVG